MSAITEDKCRELLAELLRRRVPVGFHTIAEPYSSLQPDHYVIGLRPTKKAAHPTAHVTRDEVSGTFHYELRWYEPSIFIAHVSKTTRLDMFLKLVERMLL